ncbi:hypothetical protein [Atlantibacter sp. RC6]|uniref:hypothetical protein n=1 Tax=Atlantibacter sp. RC6 TaxID=2587036 RepID=UPI001606A35F|nr:hypothetical protein [Atlantibacter sp. RC6]MBB3323618.1 hypothetical protein [Atlantibacter sp. RC6]
MSDSMNNKELVAVGHQFAKAMSSETPILDIAKIVSRLAERLDCTTAALHATQAQRDQLAAENGQMLHLLTDISENHLEYLSEGEDCMMAGVPLDYVSEINMYVSRDVEAENPFKATDAFLAEVRSSGLDEMAVAYRKFASEEGCSCNMQSSYNLTAERAESYAAYVRRQGVVQ